MVGTEIAGYQPIPTFTDWAERLHDGPELMLLHVAADRLHRTRARIGPAAADLAVKRSLLLAALHTGAIEGLHRMNRGVTLTALDNVLDWQKFVQDAEGTDARRNVEAALSAYDLAIDAARDDAMPITEAWLRRVHEEACAAQDAVTVLRAVGEQRQPLLRGRYKAAPNHVLLSDGRVHMYAPPADTPAEMHRLVDQLRTKQLSASHPVVQASYAHHALTQIHPFQDGNGRVARVVASVPLLRWTSVPFHLYEDQVGEYFRALAAADGGAPTTFVEFVRDRVHDLVTLTDDRLVAESPVEMPVVRDQELAVSIAERLDRAVTAQLAEIMENYDWPEAVAGRAGHRNAYEAGDTDAEGRHTVSGNAIRIEVRHVEAGTRAVHTLRTFVDRSLNRAFPIAVGTASAANPLTFRLADVHPEISASARVRIDAYLGRVLRESLHRLGSALGGA